MSSPKSESSDDYYLTHSFLVSLCFSDSDSANCLDSVVAVMEKVLIEEFFSWKKSV